MASKAFFSTPPFMGHNESYFPPLKSSAHAGQILAGPTIMITAGLLQVIKKLLTGKIKSDLYNHIWKFISKAEARDKVGRIAQYGCRCLQGILNHASPEFPLQPYREVIAEVQTTLAWCRRTNRWGKEMPHIPTLGTAICEGDLLQATQSMILIMFLVQDHIYWLLKVGILKFQAYTPIQWHRRNLRFITMSHVFNFAVCYREICRIRAKQEAKDPKYSGSAEAIKKAEDDVYDNKRMLVRYVLTFFQMIHVSGVKQLDDWYVGIMGMMSSYIDASKQW